MNIKSLLVGLKMAIPFIGDFKKVIFVDGKFNPTRAIMIFVFLITIIISISYIGVDNTSDAVDLLDDISDVIGQTD